MFYFIENYNKQQQIIQLLLTKLYGGMLGLSMANVMQLHAMNNRIV